ncbi:MAG: hypothetical protein LIO90_09785 [Bacteroidales bacterium]|nr:hypothetical protein [Bacteroidales bacterium]
MAVAIVGGGVVPVGEGVSGEESLPRREVDFEDEPASGGAYEEPNPAFAEVAALPAYHQPRCPALTVGGVPHDEKIRGVASRVVCQHPEMRSGACAGPEVDARRPAIPLRLLQVLGYRPHLDSWQAVYRGGLLVFLHDWPK